VHTLLSGPFERQVTTRAVRSASRILLLALQHSAVHRYFWVLPECDERHWLSIYAAQPQGVGIHRTS